MVAYFQVSLEEKQWGYKILYPSSAGLHMAADIREGDVRLCVWGLDFQTASYWLAHYTYAYG